MSSAAVARSWSVSRNRCVGHTPVGKPREEDPALSGGLLPRRLGFVAADDIGFEEVRLAFEVAQAVADFLHLLPGDMAPPAPETWPDRRATIKQVVALQARWERRLSADAAESELYRREVPAIPPIAPSRPPASSPRLSRRS